MKPITMLLAILFFAPVLGASSSPSVTAALSEETRALLIREMQAVSESMGRIHRAMVTGDHAVVAAEAQKIHDSFVLAQELSDAQREEIQSTLPDEFVAADQAFHQLAVRLAQAGEHGDPKLQRFWFEEMTRACQACHASYGGARFPGLVPEPAGRHEH